MRSYYRNIDTLPIWNFDKIQNDNDLRYLLKLKDYDMLPKVNKYLMRELVYHYAKIVGQFKNPILKQKHRILKEIAEFVIDISKNSKDADKIQKASVVLRALMIDTTKENLLWDVNFTETPEQRQRLTSLSVKLKKFNARVDSGKSKKKVDLAVKKARIESVLGVSIDVRNCTVKEFMAYTEEATTKINLSNKYVN